MNKMEKEKVAIAIQTLRSAMKHHDFIIVTAEEVIEFLEQLDSGKKYDM
jgi:hypothetical protein